MDREWRTEKEQRVLHIAMLKQMANQQSQMTKLIVRKALLKEQTRLLRLAMIETAASIQGTLP